MDLSDRYLSARSVSQWYSAWLTCTKALGSNHTSAKKQKTNYKDEFNSKDDNNDNGQLSTDERKVLIGHWNAVLIR